MINAASIKPTNKNILVCKVFINSGCHAEASKNLLPIIPIPIQAPAAPRPIIKPAEIATKPTTDSMTSP